jgi:group I intron endonuclease
MSQAKICGVYKITHIASGKSYIGISKNIERRWIQHKSWANTGKRKSAIYAAFQKYGIDAFSWQIIEQCQPDQLEIREQHWIAVFDTFRNGYNLTAGGEYNKELSEESRKRMSEAHKGRKQSEELIAKRVQKTSGENHYRFGKTCSDETRRKISEKLTGLKQSDETKAKRSKSLTGRKMSIEAVEKSRIARTGIKFSEQARKNLSEAHKGKKQSPETIRKRIESTKATLAAKKLAQMQVNSQIQ